ncbi:hypothetical protein J3R30DRAFT_3722858 [Lentinula aciculospora]|uniref:Uncharacterized protein n=1 Tax=Lentinula aciculospora TaxID=153920 RepID=A0A9W8ZSV2_9AGAR|nr:hypothetical protein J3R30DRAFT_3722858 [Lentinula aciculospora]
MTLQDVDIFLTLVRSNPLDNSPSLKPLLSRDDDDEDEPRSLRPLLSRDADDEDEPPSRKPILSLSCDDGNMDEFPTPVKSDSSPHCRSWTSFTSWDAQDNLVCVENEEFMYVSYEDALGAIPVPFDVDNVYGREPDPCSAHGSVTCEHHIAEDSFCRVVKIFNAHMAMVEFESHIWQRAEELFNQGYLEPKDVQHSWEAATRAKGSGKYKFCRPHPWMAERSKCNKVLCHLLMEGQLMVLGEAYVYVLVKLEDCRGIPELQKLIVSYLKDHEDDVRDVSCLSLL